MRERRVTRAAAGRIAGTLSERDWAILKDVARVRVLTGQQLQRLHFAALVGQHRDRTRRQVLERLVALDVLATLERRIGGIRAGSAGLVYALGPVGQRLLALEGVAEGGRVRRPSTPTDRFLDHTLAGAELYVRLKEIERGGGLALVAFEAEPRCWWRDSEGEWIKPDAYAVVGLGDVEDGWAIEVDMGSESLPTLKRKLVAYIELAAGGESGPQGGPLPRVLVAVKKNYPYLPNDEAVAKRMAAVRELVSALPDPSRELLTAALLEHAPSQMARGLKE